MQQELSLVSQLFKGTKICLHNNVNLQPSIIYECSLLYAYRDIFADLQNFHNIPAQSLVSSYLLRG